jgi:hypothetical protein
MERPINMRVQSRFVLAAAILASAAACKHVPGGPSLPSTPSVPGGVPSTSGEVDPNTCGNYAATDAGAKFKAFLQSVKDLDTATIEATKVIKQSCVMMGNELGMSADDVGGDDTGAICNKVFDTYKANLKVSLKAKAKLKVSYTPAKCTVDASASASASGGCSGAAAAGSGGAGASGQCAAAASVNASLHVNCTPAAFSISADAKMVADKSKFDATVKAIGDGLPKLLDVGARTQGIKDAADAVAQAGKELAEMGPKFANSFSDQALCIAAQVKNTVTASTRIQANVSVSVSVSASASASTSGS